LIACGRRRGIVNGVSNRYRPFGAIVLVLLHLLVAPCATAMMPMPTDMDCEHCRAINAPDACLVAGDSVNCGIGAVAFDPGRNDPPPGAAQFSRFLPAGHANSWPGALTSDFRTRAFVARHTGDPPLYLLLSQLRI